jgi:hypothetical protein
MTKAVADFIEALLVHYPVRHDTEEREDAWVNSMIGALRGFEGDLLKEVATDIIRTRKYRNFPLLSEILDKCDDIEKRREARKREAVFAPLRPAADSDLWSTERCRLAYQLIHGGMGREAAQDNPCWVLALWHFCRRNQRLPSGTEIDACKRAAREFDEAYADAVHGEAPDKDGVMRELANGRALQNLGASMLAKREKLIAEVMGR